MNKEKYLEQRNALLKEIENLLKRARPKMPTLR